MKQIELCKKLGISQGTLSGWENGKIEPGIKAMFAMADIFGITVDELLGKSLDEEKFVEIKNIIPIKKRKFQMLRDVACGKPITCGDEWEGYVEASSNIDADFCLRCRGDSMTGARILDGDIVFVKKQSMVDNGQIAVVVIDNEATLKRVYYYPQNSKLVLQAENPLYEPLVYVNEELNNIYIIGKAVAFQSCVK